MLLTTEHGDIFAYDHVILACHSDTALDILRAGNIAEEEERILNHFSWNRNEVILHSDTRVCAFPLVPSKYQKFMVIFVVDDAAKPQSLVMLELPFIYGHGARYTTNRTRGYVGYYHGSWVIF